VHTKFSITGQLFVGRNSSCVIHYPRGSSKPWLVAKTDARAVKFHGYNSSYIKLNSKKMETAKQGQLGHNNITFAQKHSPCLCSIHNLSHQKPDAAKRSQLGLKQIFTI